MPAPRNRAEKTGSEAAPSEHEQTKSQVLGELNTGRAIVGSKAGETSKLNWQQSGLLDKFGDFGPRTLSMDEVVPAGLKSRPNGLVAPRYGKFEIGPAGKAVTTFVIVDGPKGHPATLYVNRKADGEMIDETGHPMTLKSGKRPDGSEWTLYGTQVSLDIPFTEGSRKANLEFLRFDPQRKPDLYELSLFLAADYGYAGTTTIDGKPVPTLVLDTSCTGEINLMGNRNRMPLFWFDFNGDGKRNAGEVVNGSQPFQFHGKWWAVTSMGNDGTICIASDEMALNDKVSTVAQARALEEYLAANPNARNFRDGLQQLFVYYRDEAKDKKRALATLEREYQYLVARANAKELKEGLRFQFECYVGIEAEDRALVALEREHAFLVKETPRDFGALGTNLNEWVYRLTASNKPASLAKARELISRGKKEFAGSTDKEGTSHLFAACEGMCGRPVVGGALKIAFTALDGTRVDLAAMKGKVVLVDYWATWCGPCVASLPGIKSAYDKYHAKGFEVIGISLDGAERKDMVVKFLKDHSLSWPQSFDGKGWNTPSAVTYGITAIPATFLVGKDGRIAAVDIHGEELVTMLAKLVK